MLTRINCLFTYETIRNCDMIEIETIDDIYYLFIMININPLKLYSHVFATNYIYIYIYIVLYIIYYIYML